MTEGEWLLVEPFLPGVSPIGRPRVVALRTVVNAVPYMASTGCQCRQIPSEFAPRTTVQGISAGGRRTAHGLGSATNGGQRGYDAGKKIKGRKRHIATDTEGHLVGLQVHPADIQHRDGAIEVLASIRHLYRWLRHVFAGATPATS